MSDSIEVFIGSGTSVRLVGELVDRWGPDAGLVDCRQATEEEIELAALALVQSLIQRGEVRQILKRKTMKPTNDNE